MKHSLKYNLGIFTSLPLLPLLYFQGKNIRKNVPTLPEAKETTGFVNNNFSSDLHILTIGESTIAGVGVDYHKNGFTGALAKKLSTKLQKNIHWRVYARSGYTVAKVTTKIIPKIKETKIDLIVIGMGGNDAFTLNSPKKWLRDIENLIVSIQDKFPEAPIYFTNMPPIKEFPAFTKTIKFVIGNLVEIFGSELKNKLQSKKNVFYYDEIITLKNWSERNNLSHENSSIYFSDGVHPSELTYKIWANEMATFINSKFKA